ncbi:MAG: hypothetical protein LWY06_13030, partial [Firmicutes bacterium]|nr:hypothetical protein [Bacillota bacterium]
MKKLQVLKNVQESLSRSRFFLKSATLILTFTSALAAFPGNSFAGESGVIDPNCKDPVVLKPTIYDYMPQNSVTYTKRGNRY